MGIEQLTDSDRRTIKETHFLRIDGLFYRTMYVVTALIGILVLMAPTLGPRNKPHDWKPPETLEEYFLRLIPYLIILALFALVPLLDMIIRRIELSSGTKKTVMLKLTSKWTSKWWTLLLFTPFHVSLFRRYGQLRGLQPGDSVAAVMTSMNRIIDFNKRD